VASPLLPGAGGVPRHPPERADRRVRVRAGLCPSLLPTAAGPEPRGPARWVAVPRERVIRPSSKRPGPSRPWARGTPPVPPGARVPKVQQGAVSGALGLAGPEPGRRCGLQGLGCSAVSGSGLRERRNFPSLYTGLGAHTPSSAALCLRERYVPWPSEELHVLARYDVNDHAAMAVYWLLIWRTLKRGK